MSLYTTAGTPRAIVKPTTDKQKLLNGIGLIAADNGAGMFFDALVEAADRINKDKTPGLPRHSDGRVGLRESPGARPGVRQAAEHHRR